MRRIPAALGTFALLVSLAACGDKPSDSGVGDPGDETGLGAVTVNGEFGKAPEVTIDQQVTTDTLASKTVIEGSGDTATTGDSVKINIWIGDGVSQKQVYSTWEKDPSTHKVPGAQSVTLSEGLPKWLLSATVDHKVGSRVLVVAPPADAFGDGGNSALGIGNADDVVFVIDITELTPQPKPVDVPSSQMPKIVDEKGEPVRFDFTGLPKPTADGDLLRSVITEGTGVEVTTAMTVTADYLGSVYGAKKPFDESFSKQPVPFALTGVIQGWTYSLKGLKVGSRVLLAIPPRYGYGDQAQPNIPANSTLYFVVDIKSAQ